VGEAAANAVEHAYAHTDQPGEFSYLLTHRSDGAIDVEVRDSGHWRTKPPINNAHRGRGLAVIRAIATDITIDTGPEGTQVRFRLPAPPAEPVPSCETQTAVPRRTADPSATR
jgi:anti-sigma regulatory factor (Ser/Thr protein kinase)